MKSFIVSKQELYFAKRNYEIFSTEISAREKLRQNNAGPHHVPCSSLFVVQFLLLPSSCEVSLRKRFQKSPVNADFLEFVIKRLSANYSWRPSTKAAPKRPLSFLINGKRLMTVQHFVILFACGLVEGWLFYPALGDYHLQFCWLDPLFQQSTFRL